MAKCSLLIPDSPCMLSFLSRQTRASPAINTPNPSVSLCCWKVSWVQPAQCQRTAMPWGSKLWVISSKYSQKKTLIATSILTSIKWNKIESVKKEKSLRLWRGLNFNIFFSEWRTRGAGHVSETQMGTRTGCTSPFNQLTAPAHFFSYQCRRW